MPEPQDRDIGNGFNMIKSVESYDANIQFKIK